MHPLESMESSTQIAKLNPARFEEIAGDIALLAWLGNEKALMMQGNLDVPIDYRYEVTALGLLFDTIQEMARKIFDPSPLKGKNAEA